MAEIDPATHRYREQVWPWPLLAFVAFVIVSLIAIGSLERGADRIGFFVVAGSFSAAVVAHVATRRRVTIGPAGLGVGARMFAWDDIAETRVREVPIARAGMFVKLTDAARARHGVPPPRHRDFGFGLAPAPNRELHEARYDLFLRARRDQLEEWFMLVNLRLLHQVGDQLRSIQSQLVPTGVPRADAHAATPRADVHASVIVAEPDAVTIELRAPSIDAVIFGAERALQAALPDDARWNPQFAGRVMVLVGPLELASDPRADACLAHVKAAVRSAIVGQPHTIAAMYAGRP